MTEGELRRVFTGNWPGERTRRAAEDRPLLWNRVLGAAIQDTIDTERAKALPAWQRDRLDEAEALLRSVEEDGLPDVTMEGPRPKGGIGTAGLMNPLARPACGFNLWAGA